MQTEAIWWMPCLEPVDGMPPQQTTGTLSIDARGINLRTTEYFINNLVDGMYVPVTEPPSEQLALITSRGHAPDYLPITLYKPNFINGRFLPLKGASYPNGMEISTEWAFVGGHFTEVENVRFSGIHVELSLLDLWLDKVQVKASPSYSHNFTPIGESVHCRVEFQPASPFPLYECPEYVITAEIRASVNGMELRNLWSPTGYCVSQQPYIRIRFTTPATIEEVYAIIQRLRLFLSICLRRNVYIRGMHGSSERQRPVRIYNAEVLTQQADDSYPPPYGLLAPYDNVVAVSPNSYERWVRSLDKLMPVYQLYLGILANVHPTTETKFLALAQALEGYHRIQHRGNRVLPKAQYEAMKTAIVTAVPGEYKEWLEEKLRYANEPTLRTRLATLIAEHKDVLAQYIPNLETFQSLVVNTRNYLTHPSGSISKAIATGTELEIINSYLQMLLELCFLDELGLQNSKQEWLLLFSENARQRIPSIVETRRQIQASRAEMNASSENSG